MPKVFPYASFTRNYKKFIGQHPEFKKRVLEKLRQLGKDPYAPALHFHKLTGRLEDFYAIWIDYDNRIVIDPDFKNDTFYLVSIGPHDDVY